MNMFEENNCKFEKCDKFEKDYFHKHDKCNKCNKCEIERNIRKGICEVEEGLRSLEKALNELCKCECCR